MCRHATTRLYCIGPTVRTESVGRAEDLHQNKDRRRIDDGTAPPQLKDREWHGARLERDGSTGRIDIFVDDSKQPVLKAADTTIPSGRVGLGSFDDTGEFRNFSVTGSVK